MNIVQCTYHISHCTKSYWVLHTWWSTMSALFKTIRILSSCPWRPCSQIVESWSDECSQRCMKVILTFSPIYSTSIDRRNSSDMSSLCASKRSRILKIILTQRKILSDIIFVPSIQNFKQLKMWQNWCFSVSPVYSFGKPPQHFYEVVPTVWKNMFKFLEQGTSNPDLASLMFIKHNSTIITIYCICT